MNPETLLSWMAAWLLTFAVHSSVLLAGAWLLTKSWHRLAETYRELAWKLALLGALVSASCQLALVAEPLAGHLTQVARFEIPAGRSELSLAPIESERVLQSHSRPDSRESTLPFPTTEQAQKSPQAVATSVTWETLSVLFAALTACIACLHGFIRSLPTWWLLRRRQPIRDGAAPAMLGRLTAKAGYWRAVRLSSHSEMQTAIAFGVFRPEICLPDRALTELGEQGLESMLAHELGHLMRRDPLWLRISGCMVVLFPWQPLLRKARRELQLLAEYRSDAIAAELTGSLNTARCLLEVAGWMAAGRQALPLGVTGMAGQGSALRQRVERLLKKDRPGVLRHRLWLLPLSTAVLTAATTLLPGAELQEVEVQAKATVTVRDAEATALDLLGKLIEQMQTEFEELHLEVALLRAELASDSPDQELLAMLAQLDAKLASLERHRDLFLGVMDEWLEPRVAESRADSNEGTEPQLRGDRK